MTFFLTMIGSDVDKDRQRVSSLCLDRFKTTECMDCGYKFFGSLACKTCWGSCFSTAWSLSTESYGVILTECYCKWYYFLGLMVMFIL